MKTELYRKAIVLLKSKIATDVPTLHSLNVRLAAVHYKAKNQVDVIPSIGNLTHQYKIPCHKNTMVQLDRLPKWSVEYKGDVFNEVMDIVDNDVDTLKTLLDLMVTLSSFGISAMSKAAIVLVCCDYLDYNDSNVVGLSVHFDTLSRYARPVCEKLSGIFKPSAYKDARVKTALFKAIARRDYYMLSDSCIDLCYDINSEFRR